MNSHRDEAAIHTYRRESPSINELLNQASLLIGKLHLRAF